MQSTASNKLYKLAVSLLFICLSACSQNTSSSEVPTTEKKIAEKTLNKSKNAIKEIKTKKDIQNNYRKHASLAQLHRWYQYYENNQVGLDNQLDILHEKVKINTAQNSSTGHAEYSAAVKLIPTTWKNSHFVKTTEINPKSDDSVSLATTITYQNTGAAADGAISQAKISYGSTLSFGDEILPKFTEINIEATERGQTDKFLDAYPENRLKSLMHYWLAIIEHPERNADPAKEILADNFELNFPSGTIDNFPALKTWLKNTSSQVETTIHYPKNFSYITIDKNTYKMQVDFDWKGITPTGQSMIAETRHNWTIIDNPENRFAQIKIIEVQVLKPFQMVE